MRLSLSLLVAALSPMPDMGRLVARAPSISNLSHESLASHGKVDRDDDAMKEREKMMSTTTAMLEIIVMDTMMLHDAAS